MAEPVTQDYRKGKTGEVVLSGLGKCYRIYKRPQDRLREGLGFRRRSRHTQFWALRNIDLTIRKGETWGIIGKNGSGKSTLLQILCGTVQPTEGYVHTEGRIAALLELGAGFNPEFTGEENIALNASLLGLTDDEIAALHDEIVAFADIGDFINQPVKKYSSGMFVRLAFAIASHADPDILVVDEALSVGDIAFQNKCINRIKYLRDRGMTLIFVSHDLSRLQLICDQAAWLHQGQLMATGEPIRVCQDYYSFTATQECINADCDTTPLVPQHETGSARFISLMLKSEYPLDASNTVSQGESLGLQFELEAIENLEDLVFAISIYATDGTWMIGQTSLDEGVKSPGIASGRTIIGQICFDTLYLSPGDYQACIGAYSKDLSILYALTDLHLAFSVRASIPRWGKYYQPCRWTLTESQ